MKINDKAILKTSKEIEIRASIDIVWKFQADIESWVDWHRGISEVKLNGLIEPGTQFEWKSGEFKLHSVLEEVIENKSIGWFGSGFGSSAVHVWEFIPILKGTILVRTTESMDGWFVKLFSGTMEKS
ncbi:MAG: polyketide cyclase/dehydrase and lipid transport [Bacteroidetes bacterium]|jgi:hypothetical protein|nr:polyketide cyclase/dehydrase and lipid transport [Bacteroidota bacterium]